MDYKIYHYNENRALIAHAGSNNTNPFAGLSGSKPDVRSFKLLQRAKVCSLPSKLPMLTIKYMFFLFIRIYLWCSFPKLPAVSYSNQRSQYWMQVVLLPSSRPCLCLFHLSHRNLCLSDWRTVYKYTRMPSDYNSGLLHSMCKRLLLVSR